MECWALVLGKLDSGYTDTNPNIPISFTIENDGSPVDIVTNHGSDSLGDQKGGKGSVILSFGEKVC